MPQSNSSFDVTDEKNDLGETVVSESDYCGSASNIWFYVSYGLQTCLLICASVLAYQMRSVPNVVNDSKPLAFMIYSSFFFLTLRFVMFVVGESVGEESASIKTSLQLARSIFISLDAIADVLIFFARMFLKKETKKKLQSNKGASHFMNNIARRQSSTLPTASETTYDPTLSNMNDNPNPRHHERSLKQNVSTRRASAPDAFTSTAPASLKNDTEASLNVQLADAESARDKDGNPSIVRIRMKDGGKTVDMPRWVLEEYGTDQYDPLVNDGKN